MALKSKKKSVISDKYWKRLKEEKERQLSERGFYRKANWSKEFREPKSVDLPDLNIEGMYDVISEG